MTQSTFYDLAKSLLDKQLTLTTKLHTLLLNENEKLHSRQGDFIETSANEKQPIILNIDTLNQHWLSLLELEGADIDIEGINIFLNDYDKSKATNLLYLWENILNMAKKCQRLNTINGATLTLQNQVTQQAMAILRGHTPGNTLYNYQGSETPNCIGGKSIAKA